MNNLIHVAYSYTDYLWENIYISLKSLLDKSSIAVETILIYENIDAEIKEKFIDLISQYQNKHYIRFVQVPKPLLNKMAFIKVSNSCDWFRIVVSKLCPDINKLIYMTSACSVVLDDIVDFYSIDLQDNYFAGVRNIQLGETFAKKYNLNVKYTCRIDIILINCIKFREDNAFDIIIDHVKNNSIEELRLEPTFNKLFEGYILELPLKYNYQDLWFAKLFNIASLNIKGYKEAITAPLIVNYIGLAPRFSNCNHPMKQAWWDVVKNTNLNIEDSQSYKLSATSAQNSFNYVWLLKRIAPYIKPYWFRILVGFAISIPLGLLDGVTALALKPYMDYVVGNKALEFSFQGLDFSITSLQMAWILPIGIVLFAGIQGCLRYLNSYLSAWVSRKITIDVRFDLFNRLINMHPQFFDDNSSGIINSRYIGDPKTASASIVDNLRAITTDICGALGLIAVMMYSSWKLALVGVLVLCVAFIPVALIRKRIRETSNKNMVISGKITTNMNETHSGSKVMTAYGLQQRQEKLFHEQILESFKISMSLTKRTAWMSPLMYQIASVGIAIVLGYGTYLISTGQMTAGSFASFVTSLLLLYKPVKSLGGTLTGIQNIFVAMGRVFELFDLTPAISDCEKPKELKSFEQSITFKNVVFEYIPNKPVLRNLNLDVKKNETLAIVGNSGGGKSTLVNLIPRFYDVKSGSIEIDGVDIKDFSLKSLRQNISMVFQDNFLFSGTIKENIMMGNPNASIEELMSAIKAAHLEDMIAELPEGLETELGERGLTLSGGQRQRVAIARAMLRNAPIVILDEATSALDNESEAIVQKAMDNLMQNRTVFIIAHRLSTIKNADRIAVINDGELVELGSHEELINIENGQYKTLYEMQFKKKESLV